MKKLDLKSARLFITGTDTGVGKTVLSLLVMRHLYNIGEKPFYIKLIQTGCRDPYDTDSDARMIYENVPELNGKDPAASVPYCFKNPKAPWFAARDEARKINLKVIVDAVESASVDNSVLVLEGAGGLFVPVDQSTLMIDLITMLNARPILAARAGLGTINHTLLSIESLKLRGIDPIGIVLIDAESHGTPPEMINENIEAVERFSGIKVSGVIGKVEDLSNPGRDCYRPIEEILGSAGF